MKRKMKMLICGMCKRGFNTLHSTFTKNEEGQRIMACCHCAPVDNWHETYTVKDALCKILGISGTAKAKLVELSANGHDSVKLSLVMICMTPNERQNILAAKIHEE